VTDPYAFDVRVLNPVIEEGIFEESVFHAVYMESICVLNEVSFLHIDNC
jgi:hypothetical protein